MPVDDLVEKMGDEEGIEFAKDLFFSNTNVIGVGIRGERPQRIGDKYWLYFGDPFYRATIFSNCSPHNTPTEDIKLPTLQFANGKPSSNKQAQPGQY
ncbi:Hypothetical protein PENO1_075440 [Penicillium occitanis (nom. inval.)]|nr:hypothetical protein PENOC_080400 [Penicillium occitanis (nom. inval.)]PCG95061.1 Hypothetical protein PENO1_075440 [Penicillium occitanis (nom. inval.)]